MKYLKIFNEKLENNIENLKTYVSNIFAYIADDNDMRIDIKQSEVFVEIKSIVPSAIYTDIKDYVNKHTIWNETLLDIDIAIKQIVNRGDIDYTTNINTVCNIKIKFFIKNDKVVKIDNNSITISTRNLIKLLDDESINVILPVEYNNQQIRIFFNRAKTNEEQTELSNKITEIFINSGLIYTRDESVNIDIANYDVNNTYIKFYQFKVRNNIAIRNRYKNIKLQNVL